MRAFPSVLLGRRAARRASCATWGHDRLHGPARPSPARLAPGGLTIFRSGSYNQIRTARRRGAPRGGGARRHFQPPCPLRRGRPAMRPITAFLAGLLALAPALSAGAQDAPAPADAAAAPGAAAPADRTPALQRAD